MPESASFTAEKKVDFRSSGVHYGDGKSLVRALLKWKGCGLRNRSTYQFYEDRRSSSLPVDTLAVQSI